MGSTVRMPAVAGMFYPGDPASCRGAVQALLAQANGSEGNARRPNALIVPHAGYIYSGAVAAKAFSLLPKWRAEIRRVVLLGPNHRVPLRGIAVPTTDSFRTPLGDIDIDVGLRTRIAGLDAVVVDDRPHRDEHALEVQLPFLQCVLASFRLLPLVVGECAPASVAALLEAVWDATRTLLVISSDLSHYQSHAAARAHDAATAARIESGDTKLDPDDACGARALNGFLSFAQSHALRVTRIALCNSGDTAGSRDRVVGYGAWRVD